MEKSLRFKLILLLALVQGLGGLFRGFNWVQVGSNLFGQGLLLLPMVGAVAIMRGLFITGIAALYFLFVVGGVLGKRWAFWPGVTAAILNLLLVVSAVAQGTPVVEGIVWSVLPVILLFYFFSQRGSHAIERT